MRWGGSRPESGDGGVEMQHDHSQSQVPSRQQKMSRREALAQVLEYHREGLARSLVRKNVTGGDADECRGRNGDEDGDERGKRKRRDSDVEVDRHGIGKAYSSPSTTQQQQTFSKPHKEMNNLLSIRISNSTSVFESGLKTFRPTAMTN